MLTADYINSLHIEVICSLYIEKVAYY